MPTVAEKLKVLASLCNERPGTDLVYDPRNDTFAIQVKRIKRSDIPFLLNDQPVTRVGNFAKALEDLFTRAYDEVNAGGIAQWQVDDAQRGLASLRDSYPSQPDKLQEFQVLDGVIAKIREIREKGFEHSRSRLFEDFKKFLITKLVQHEFLPRGHPGMCFGLCMDWICRKMHPARGKVWYGVGNKPSPDGALPAKRDPSLMRVRMSRKTMALIGPLQDLEELWQDGPPDKILERYRALTRGYGEARKMDPAQYIKDLVIETRASGPKTCIVNLDIPPHQGEGRQVFVEILEQCYPKRPPRGMYDVRETIKSERPPPPLPDPRGRPIERLVEQYEGYDKRSQDLLPFILTLEEVRGTGADSHVVALCKVRHGWHFYDPNLGEFDFPEAGREDFLDFLGRLWLFYRNWYRFVSWQLQHVYYSELGAFPKD